MNVLLIYPQYTHTNKFDLRAPSMSLFYLASTLERNGHEVMIYDASLGPIVKEVSVFRYGFSNEEVYSFLRSHHFDIVGISCPSAGRWIFTKKIAEQVKEVSPATPVAIGGLFPTYNWEYCIKNCLSIDFVMLGEAELNFAQILNNLSEGKNLSSSCRNVEGVAWKEADKIFYNPKIKYNAALDDLPFPAWHLVDLNKYFLLQRNIFELRTPCLPILSSRSCPNHCRFCNMYVTHGFRWRSRSAKNVLDEIEYLIQRFGVRSFYFIDDNFSLDLKRAKSICRGILEKKFNITYNFHNGLSIKTIDEELVRLMKKSGCTSVCLAIESGSERIRNEVYGKKLLSKLPMTLMIVNIFTPYPGTELYDECKKKGWLVESLVNDENRAEMSSPMLKTPDFGPEDIIGWQKELYLSFIRYHWLALIKEALRPGGVVNFDMFGKFVSKLKFLHPITNKNIEPSLVNSFQDIS